MVDMAIGLQIQRETPRPVCMCTQKINSDARPDVTPGVYTDTIRIHRPRGKCIQKTRYVYTENSDAVSETTETEAKKDTETDSCQW